LELKVKYRGLPVIRRATGTMDAAVLTDYRKMCDALYETGRHDHLRALARGTLRLPVVFSYYRAGKLHELPAGDVSSKLTAAWAAWAATLPRGKHRHDIEGCGQRMIAEADIVADLPKRLRAYRATMAHHGPAFNHARNYARAFARDTLGPSSVLYQQIKDVQAIEHRAKAGHPQSVEKLAALAEQLGPGYGEAMIGMSVTGMGPKEFWGAWDDETTHYQVHGTKRAGRERMIPRPGYVARPTVTPEALKSRLRRVSGVVTPYDARRTYMNLLVELGIPRPRRKLYLGHGAKDSADLYERPEIMDWIVADGQKLAALVGHLLKPRLQVFKAG
jgi:hypothetical protein